MNFVNKATQFIFVIIMMKHKKFDQLFVFEFTCETLVGSIRMCSWLLIKANYLYNV